MHTFSARKNLKLHVSDRQFSIILGSILGDAYVYPQGKICFEHGELQRDYLFWKYSQLKTLAYPKLASVQRLDKRTNTKTQSFRFFLRQYFRPLRELFYLHNKKQVPLQLNEWFSPLLLAVWYMDDGYLDRNKYPLLMTESFSFSEVTQLCQMINYHFGIHSFTTRKRRIRISSDSSSKFFQIVEPNIHKSMRYKLP